ncbi:hypothetical protein TNCT_4291 [Trichonephila clavata]|uniref:Uncharacterized protein n=1 Tax=Trichonephila clavata TaxID=2740835 RepID=A0A8X6IYW3_TRICU|nr:hypothetical protein TNCT_4291 [Trichonephila clavata]
MPNHKMRRRHRVDRGHLLRNYVMVKTFSNYVGRVGFVGVRDTGRNTLCERFGRLDEEVIKQFERKAYRELIIDHSQPGAPLARGDMPIRKTTLQMDVIFSKDGPRTCQEITFKYLKAIVFMFDVTKLDTLLYAMSCVREIKEAGGKDAPPYIFVGNKVDKRVDTNRNHIYHQFGKRWAIESGAERYFECSGKRGLECFDLLEYILKKFIHNPCKD